MREWLLGGTAGGSASDKIGGVRDCGDGANDDEQGYRHHPHENSGDKQCVGEKYLAQHTVIAAVRVVAITGVQAELMHEGVCHRRQNDDEAYEGAELVVAPGERHISNDRPIGSSGYGRGNGYNASGSQSGSRDLV